MKYGLRSLVAAASVCLLHPALAGTAALAPDETPPPASSELPFSEAVRVGDTIYLSGQVGIAPGETALVPGGVKEETRQTMLNIKAALEAQGYAMRDIVKCTVMLADISRWDEFNAVYRTFFISAYPARSTFGVNGLSLGAQVEIECMAAKGAKAG